MKLRQLSKHTKIMRPRWCSKVLNVFTAHTGLRTEYVIHKPKSVKMTDYESLSRVHRTTLAGVLGKAIGNTSASFETYVAAIAVFVANAAAWVVAYPADDEIDMYWYEVAMWIASVAVPVLLAVAFAFNWVGKKGEAGAWDNTITYFLDLSMAFLIVNSYAFPLTGASCIAARTHRGFAGLAYVFFGFLVMQMRHRKQIGASYTPINP